MRLTPEGEKMWEQSLGGTSSEILSDVRQTQDGGFIVCGWSGSGPNGNKTSTNHGGDDFWVVRLDANGGILWDRSYGGSQDEMTYQMIPLWDGGFLVGGSSSSLTNGTKTSPFYGAEDLWLVRLDANGTQIWNESFGGNSFELTPSLLQTRDGGYLMAGHSASGISGNKTVEIPDPTVDVIDFWVVKLRPDVVTLRTPPQTLASIQAGGFRLQLSGPTNTYVVEAATNPASADWQPFITNTLTGNSTEILDVDADRFPRRFYRARTAP
jgi:hypothetical protein